MRPQKRARLLHLRCLISFASSMNEKNKIQAFLARYFRNRELGEQEDIFAAGFVNSLFAMQIILFVEKEFKIAIASEDLELANFRTIEAITSLVKRKRSTSPNIA